MIILTEIDITTKEYRSLLNSEHYTSSQANAIYDTLPKFDDINATLDIGCYTTNIYEYHLDMKVTYCDETNRHSEITLINLITNITPKVESFKTIKIFSCLDG